MMNVKIVSEWQLQTNSFTKDKIYEVNNSVISHTEDYYGVINDTGDLVVVVSTDVEIIKERLLIVNFDKVEY